MKNQTTTLIDDRLFKLNLSLPEIFILSKILMFENNSIQFNYTIKQISNIINLSEISIKRYMSNLTKHGLIERVNDNTRGYANNNKFTILTKKFYNILENTK
jgi:predicted transcriptional regulator